MEKKWLNGEKMWDGGWRGHMNIGSEEESSRETIHTRARARAPSEKRNRNSGAWTGKDETRQCRGSASWIHAGGLARRLACIDQQAWQPRSVTMGAFTGRLFRRARHDAPIALGAIVPSLPRSIFFPILLFFFCLREMARPITAISGVVLGKSDCYKQFGNIYLDISQWEVSRSKGWNRHVE